jgi:hypothetical protein
LRSQRQDARRLHGRARPPRRGGAPTRMSRDGSVAGFDQPLRVAPNRRSTPGRARDRRRSAEAL